MNARIGGFAEWLYRSRLRANPNVPNREWLKKEEERVMFALARIKFKRPGPGVVGSFGTPSMAALAESQRTYDLRHHNEVVSLECRLNSIRKLL